MNCAKCGLKLVIREGKFGEFLACTNSNPSDNHGTVSLRPVPYRHTSIRTSSSLSLLDQVKRRTIAFGGGLDDMTRLCEDIVDSTADLYDELGNETDHWMNERPY